MFKGNNTLTLNEATLIEAVSEYMAKRSAVGFAPVVKSVKHCTDNRGYTGQLFTVEISAPVEIDNTSNLAAKIDKMMASELKDIVLDEKRPSWKNPTY